MPANELVEAKTVQEVALIHRELIAQALEQARIGFAEGGVPIGAALAINGKTVALGRNRRVQQDSVIRHAEMDALENAGRLSAAAYRKSVMYTTLAPCQMCAGTILLYQIPHVVIAENRHFSATEECLRSHGWIFRWLSAVVPLGLSQCSVAA